MSYSKSDFTVAPHKNEKALYAYAFLSAFFCAALVIGACLGSKLSTILGITVSVSALTYPLTFLITDAVSEVFGKKAAQRIVYSGVICLILCFLLIQLALALPEAAFWENAQGYGDAFGLTARLIVAGTIAYFISQTFDVWAFHRIRQSTSGKHLWLRNNISTAISQAIDTGIFVFIGFYGIAPLWELFIGQYLVKLVLAFFDTPFVYLLTGYLRKLIGADETSTENLAEPR